MKLRKLEITGFKSFVDKTDIVFPRGVSAVVGPNGCGKSNLVDALRWAMGEQSVKQLRGKSMEDVIFSGTDDRARTNVAEVTLTLENENGTAPEAYRQFTEIRLTRRLFRTGDGGYFINRQPCRLKDVHNLISGSGLSGRSYAIIQQGNIGAITEADPEERRYYLEEAAGVTRYKTRKKETLKKIEATRENLLRAKDIIAEIEDRMKRLKRQVKKARLHEKYRARLRSIEIRLAVRETDALTTKIEETEALLQSARDADIEQSTRLSKLTAAVEAVKLRRHQKEQELTEITAELHQLQRSLDKLEKDIAYKRREADRLAEEIDRLTQERIALAASEQTMEAEAAALLADKNRFAGEIDSADALLREKTDRVNAISKKRDDAVAAREEVKRRLAELSAEEARHRSASQTAETRMEQLAGRRKRILEAEATVQKTLAESARAQQAIQAELSTIEETIGTHDAEINEIRGRLDRERETLSRRLADERRLSGEHQRAKTAHKTLARMEANHEWYRGGVRALLSLPVNETDNIKNTDIYGVLADFLTPDPKWETAASAALGDALQYVVVKDQTAARAALDYVKANGKGRVGILPSADIENDAEEINRPLPGGVETLLSRVSVKSAVKSVEAAAASLLRKVVVATDLEAAISLKKLLGAACVVTEQGEVITPAGVWVGGGGDDGLSDLLVKKREIRTMAEQVKTLSASLAETRRLRDETEAGIRELEADLQKQTMRRTELSETKTKRENDLFRSRETERLEASRLESIREELDGIEDEVDAADGILRESTGIVDETTREIDELKKRSADLATEVEELTTGAKAAEADIVEDRLVLARARAGMENAESALRRLAAYRTEADRRKAAMTEDIRAKTEQRDAIRKEIETDAETRRQTTEKLNRRISEEEKQASEFAEVDEALKAHDDEMGTIRTKRDSLVQKIRVLEVELSRFRIRRDNVISQISDRCRRPFAELRREMECGDEDENTPTEVLSAELSALQKKLDRLGPVNPDAVGEYEALTERHEFLCGQRSDLEQAIEDLQKVIRKINKITQTRFLETVSEVNEKLSEVFPRLFEGGTAELVLTEPDAPLETGVEYMIRPPGKKLTRQSLLSGGEKALCAIAFVFSIFLIKPTSFCIMDEIDAPLDEANVLRFNKLLKLIGEKSQIIMITHQKRTMEFADRLYGVTMETKGISKVVSVNLQGGKGEAAPARRAAEG